MIQFVFYLIPKRCLIERPFNTLIHLVLSYTKTSQNIMKTHFLNLNIALAVAAQLVFVGCASTHKDIGSTDHPSKQDAGRAPQMQLPAGWTPADMQAYALAGTPGANQQKLARGVGHWSGTSTMWMAPGMEPMKNPMTSTVSSIMDGRYTKTEAAVDFKRDAKYPVAFIVHGGPQGSMANDWHYRWNGQNFAGAGYGVVMIDFHGSTGYGQAFTDSISGDWGGKPLKDLQLGLAAALKQFPWLDADRMHVRAASCPSSRANRRSGGGGRWRRGRT